MDVVAGIKSAIEVVKRLLELTRAAKDNKLHLLISELELKLAGLNSQLAALMNENVSLKEEVRKLRSETVAVQFRDGAYYTADGDGPFCTVCYDERERLIRLSDMPRTVAGSYGRWRCGSCKNYAGSPPAQRKPIGFGSTE